MSTKKDVAEMKQEMATKADVTRLEEMKRDKICSDFKLGKCMFNGLIFLKKEIFSIAKTLTQ